MLPICGALSYMILLKVVPSAAEVSGQKAPQAMSPAAQAAPSAVSADSEAAGRNRCDLAILVRLLAGG